MKRILFIFVTMFIALFSPVSVYALDRIAVTFTNGDLYLKEGPINAEWHQLTSGVNIGEVDLASDYIGLIDDGGGNPKTFSVKDPSWDSPWNMVHYNNAEKVAMTQTSDGLYRMVILQTDGSVVMKDGVWNSGYWSGTLEASGVVDIVVGGDNVGVIMSNGDFKAKRLTPTIIGHPNNKPWQLVAQNVDEAAMTNDWVAVLYSNGYVHAKDGGVNGQWANWPIYSYASAVRMSGDRICAVVNPGQLRVDCKEGSLLAMPVLTYLDAVDFKLSPTRFLALKANGTAEAMDGSLKSNGGWQFVSIGNAAAIEIN